MCSVVRKAGFVVSDQRPAGGKEGRKEGGRVRREGGV